MLGSDPILFSDGAPAPSFSLGTPNGCAKLDYQQVVVTV